jgi:hypothetical protein
METNELINIWNTLAENKIIGEHIARENIERIISKERGGIIRKMVQKSKVDYYIFLFGAILIPLILLIVHFIFPGPFPNLQSYVGLSAIELFFIYMLTAAIRNRKFLETSFFQGSIKDSVEKVNAFLNKYLKKYFRISLTFGYIFLIIALIRFITRIGGVANFSLAASGFTLFASQFILVIGFLMLIWPLLIKVEITIRYSGIRREVDSLLGELNSDENNTRGI